MDNEFEGFRDAMRAAGLEPPAGIVADSKIHRFATNDKPGDTAGWYVLFGDGIPSGAFGDWRDSDSKHSWRADLGRSLSTEEEAVIHARNEAARRARDEEYAQRKAEAREKAVEIWQAVPPAGDDHPYLTAKGVKAHGLRVLGDELVIPLSDDTGLHSLQFINAQSGKRFLPGGSVKGCYFSIGLPSHVGPEMAPRALTGTANTDEAFPSAVMAVCIAEGYATGASIHEATGLPVAVAFNAGNLPQVAVKVRANLPGVQLVICADDDAGTPQNPGLAKAREAAQAVGGAVVVPEFGADRPAGATDFNDLHGHKGLAAVRDSIFRVIPASSDVSGETNVWPEPKAIFAELKPVPAFDAELLLPPALRGWVMDEAERMPCPPDFVAVAAIVAIGAVIGARCAINPKTLDSWQIVPNLWGGIVGDPSAKKSPAWAAAFKPMDLLSARAFEEHRSAMEEYGVAGVVYEAQKEGITSRIKAAAKKSGNTDTAACAQEMRMHCEQEPAAPTLRRYKSNDSTVEKLGELLRENPAGLMVMRDELVALFSIWDREGREGDRAFFLESWNGNQSFDTDRIARGHISIPNVCLSVFGGIQPDKLTGYLEKTAHALSNDGLLQRFQMLVYPDPCPWAWRDRIPDEAARATAVNVFEELSEFDPVSWGASPAGAGTKFPWFSFDEAAQTVFIAWSEDLHRERMPNEDNPLMVQHLAKYDKLFPALALIFHLVACAASGLRGPVSAEAAFRAAAWCEYLEAHARRCYGLLKDDGLRAAQSLAAKLKKGALEDGFTLRDVRRNQWRNLTTDDYIQAALDWLEGEDWVRSESSGGTGPGSGRRTIHYKINPALRTKSKEGGA